MSSVDMHCIKCSEQQFVESGLVCFVILRALQLCLKHKCKNKATELKIRLLKLMGLVDMQ